MAECFYPGFRAAACRLSLLTASSCKRCVKVNGTALTVTDEEILHSQAELAASEGIFAAPEGAATLAALKHLIQDRWVKPHEKIVLFNTGSGLKYVK